MEYERVLFGPVPSDILGLIQVTIPPTVTRTEHLEQLERLAVETMKALGEWRRFIIAVDGRDGVGKSPLARFLAWKCQIPAIETDMLLCPKAKGFIYNLDALHHIIYSRLKRDFPVIIEGCLILRTLSKIGVTPDFVIYVTAQGEEGSYTLREKFEEYEREFRPEERADITFCWAP